MLLSKAEWEIPLGFWALKENLMGCKYGTFCENDINVWSAGSQNP